jgi:hypothetical protein
MSQQIDSTRNQGKELVGKPEIITYDHQHFNFEIRS